MADRIDWPTKVGSVFKTAPRLQSEESIWLPRVHLERAVCNAIATPGVQVCIDGPTGTGKSSLALSALSKSRSRFRQVQVTRSMNWPEFCRQLVADSKDNKRSFKLQLSSGYEKLSPAAKVQADIEFQERRSDDVDLVQKLSSSWTEHDVSRLIAKHDMALLIDDFERASPDLLTRVADMCRLLTQSFESAHGKLIIIGANDISRRLYESNPTLDSRLSHVSVGAFQEDDAYGVIAMGLRKLGLYFPGHSKYPAFNEKKPECQRAVYKAVGVLPKSINELGQLLALTTRRPQDSINAQTMIDHSDRMFQSSLNHCKRQFPLMIKAIRESPEARSVLKHMYREGYCAIHSVNEFATALKEELTSEQLEYAVASLVEAGFLVRTGPTLDVLFTAEPKFAHVLGIVVSRPHEFPNEPVVKNFVEQYALPLR